VAWYNRVIVLRARYSECGEVADRCLVMEGTVWMQVWWRSGVSIKCCDDIRYSRQLSSALLIY
jgi:hypothetical protein